MAVLCGAHVTVANSDVSDIVVFFFCPPRHILWDSVIIMPRARHITARFRSDLDRWSVIWLYSPQMASRHRGCEWTARRNRRVRGGQHLYNPSIDFVRSDRFLSL